MNPQNFSLDLLRAFVAVADTKHFTRAAERLNCVQSAVSMQIQRLEDSLDTRLLERSKRQVRLTEEGKILLRYAERILQLKEQAVAEIGHQSLPGRVRIGATDWSMPYLPEVLKRLGQKYPKLDVELQCGRSWDALDALEAGKLDLAFVTQKCGRKGGKRISHSPLTWAVVSSSNVEELDPVPLALFGPGCIYRTAAIDALETAGKPYRFAYESPDRAGLECAVSAGLAVTVVPEDCLTENLRVLPPSAGGFPPLPTFNTFLFGATPRQPAAVKAFADLLTETVGNG
ncbi:LysR family transcriptional regulator [Sneathiella sp.]|uniref:LysR family transcriptional regulator n=1 Tax=Sneathiella sp. TaxID=1964365 RepID=UPI00263307F3|nr:LysR family transcriptional regulator [Sneathiella sp.]MDF2369141.1 LysR family transcriptional regulator [Sneathiella sp.]